MFSSSRLFTVYSAYPSFDIVASKNSKLFWKNTQYKQCYTTLA